MNYIKAWVTSWYERYIGSSYHTLWLPVIPLGERLLYMSTLLDESPFFPPLTGQTKYQGLNLYSAFEKASVKWNTFSQTPVKIFIVQERSHSMKSHGRYLEHSLWFHTELKSNIFPPAKIINIKNTLFTVPYSIMIFQSQQREFENFPSMCPKVSCASHTFSCYHILFKD